MNDKRETFTEAWDGFRAERGWASCEQAHLVGTSLVLVENEVSVRLWGAAGSLGCSVFLFPSLLSFIP